MWILDDPLFYTLCYTLPVLHTRSMLLYEKKLVYLRIAIISPLCRDVRLFCTCTTFENILVKSVKTKRKERFNATATTWT
ncbi:hypothetical protein GDO78_007670 [Eleutherodactylus coqui]|uniref:Uncharacterized protein n=1 Tax=Eleutherodactylus coqui TaxID=57060 RepID=A0A8J6FHX7_ELECQ|nr:hypothetical protein GDO78_007670 [Eleutherodactylus coqui]